MSVHQRISTQKWAPVQRRDQPLQRSVERSNSQPYKQKRSITWFTRVLGTRVETG